MPMSRPYPFRILLHFAKLKFQEVFTPGRFISETNLLPDPVKQFEKWYREAANAGIAFYEAMTLSTATREGNPSARVVLLKDFDENGFVFYSNQTSRKGVELAANSFAALTFFWNKTGKQVRIEGTAQRTSMLEADEYFATRPQGSQLGAWTSEQSQMIHSRNELIEKLEQLKIQFKGKPIPRPPYWIGYRVVPRQIEFWQNRPNRLHDRFLFTRANGNYWEVVRLAP